MALGPTIMRNSSTVRQALAKTSLQSPPKAFYIIDQIQLCNDLKNRNEMKTNKLKLNLKLNDQLEPI